jgi:hypothetical protein
MKTFQKALAIGVLAVTSGFASAAPIFSFTEFGGFTDVNVPEAEYLNPVAILAADTWTTISTLTHNNNMIENYTSWSGQDIWGRLILTDSDGGAAEVLDSDEAITIGLNETINTKPCSSPTPNGTTCDDFFTFTAAGLLPIFFTANDGSEWMAEFQFENFVNSALLDGKIFTGENETSSLDVQVRVTQVSSVPEPATLGMFGLGLLGLGLAKRRKQNG